MSYKACCAVLPADAQHAKAGSLIDSRGEDTSRYLSSLALATSEKKIILLFFFLSLFLHSLFHSPFFAFLVFSSPFFSPRPV